MTLLVIYVLVALGFSFLCSIAEAVLLSVTPAYIGTLEEKRPQAARRLLRQKEDIDRPLAAILSLNTIAHTVGAAGAGAQAAVVFGSGAVGLASAVLTLLILVLSEIIPKTLGAVYWRALAPVVSRIVRVLELILYPFVLLSMGLTRLLARERESAVNREEIAAMADLGAQEGEIARGESLIMKNLFRLRDLTVADVMTPRDVVFRLPDITTVAEFVRAHGDAPFSRVPIHGGNRDELGGLVLKNDVLLAHARGEGGRALSELRRDVPELDARTPLPGALERLLQGRAHLGVVRGPAGAFAGIVTLEDVIETLLGLEIVDEADSQANMQARARARWQQRAKALGLPVDEVAGPALRGTHEPSRHGETAAS